MKRALAVTGKDDGAIFWNFLEKFVERRRHIAIGERRSVGDVEPGREDLAVGLLLGVAILTDALIVRMTLVPALLTVVGPASGWPGRRLESPRPADRVPTAGAPAGPAVGEVRAAREVSGP